MNKEIKFITVIQDSNDDSTKGRITSRIQRLFNGIQPSFIAINAFSDLEAGGNIVDILDAAEGDQGIIIINAAPRFGDAKKYENGVPFGYFYWKKTLVVLTLNDTTLALLKKLGVIDEVKEFDIPKVIDEVYKQGLIKEWMVEKIKNTQFRSFEFEPRVARWIWDGIKLPFIEKEIKGGFELGPIFSIDNFGNCKTTKLANDFKFEDVIKTKIGDLRVYDWLHQLPDGEAGLVKGSSGLEKDKFLEIIVQGKSAAKEFNLKIGDNIF